MKNEMEVLQELVEERLQELRSETLAKEKYPDVGSPLEEIEQEIKLLEGLNLKLPLLEGVLKDL